MVCTSLGILLRPLFYFLCSILLIHRVHAYAESVVGWNGSRFERQMNHWRGSIKRDCIGEGEREGGSREAFY